MFLPKKKDTTHNVWFFLCMFRYYGCMLLKISIVFCVNVFFIVIYFQPWLLRFTFNFCCCHRCLQLVFFLYTYYFFISYFSIINFRFYKYTFFLFINLLPSKFRQKTTFIDTGQLPCKHNDMHTHVLNNHVTNIK